jgi:molybdopterin molybdotransferase
LLDNVISVAEAINRLLENVPPVNELQLPIQDALGYVLAQPIFAANDLPAFTNSSMDGFAVKAEDTREARHIKGVKLDVVIDIPAGRMIQQMLLNGQAARIMTGAPLPPGADAVIPVEYTDQNFIAPALNHQNQVEVYLHVKEGDFTRKKGEDVRNGERVMSPGNRLRPQDLGFLAMLGVERVTIHRKPKIAVLSTGDEVIPLGTPLEPGKIYDANSYSLGGLIQQNQCDLVRLDIVEDNVASVKAQLDTAVSQEVDLILTSAGISVGAHDYVREVIQEYGKLEFWRINMRPGKPLAFGKYRETPLVGLPGNPVSAFVGFEVVVKPAIMKMCGLKNFYRPSIKVKLTEPIQSDGRESYLRAWVWRERDQLFARLVSHQGSGNLYSLVLSNAFLIVPSEVKSLPIDAELNAWIFSEELLGTNPENNY